jgi:hypothetical protein
MDLDNLIDRVILGCEEFHGRLLSEDVGIGAYEYWGARGYDSRVVWYPESGAAFKINVGRILTADEQNDITLAVGESGATLHYSDGEGRRSGDYRPLVWFREGPTGTVIEVHEDGDP